MKKLLPASFLVVFSMTLISNKSWLRGMPKIVPGIMDPHSF